MIFLWARISPGKKRTRVSLTVKKGLITFFTASNQNTFRDVLGQH
jgi:hypothetical protein